jgi:phosphate:Na+ symporter
MLPVAIGILIFGFWMSPDFQQIAAGIAIFLFGMLMLEDGFKLLNGGYLERILERATGSVARSIVFGIVSTTIMQSSFLVYVITILFLSAGLITLIGGAGIIFGANIGTTITAIIGSIGANSQGKHLALAHLIFNAVTAGVALVFIGSIRNSIDWISADVGIADTDYALKLAVFHTIFNVLGVAIMLPALNKLIAFLERSIVEPGPDTSKPRYLAELKDRSNLTRDDRCLDRSHRPS